MGVEIRTKILVYTDSTPVFFQIQKAIIMGPLYPEPPANPSDTLFAKVTCNIVMTSIALMGIATVVGLATMGILIAVEKIIAA
jgi:hypothetical protein